MDYTFFLNLCPDKEEVKELNKEVLEDDLLAHKSLEESDFPVDSVEELYEFKDKVKLRLAKNDQSMGPGDVGHRKRKEFYISERLYEEQLLESGSLIARYDPLGNKIEVVDIQEADDNRDMLIENLMKIENQPSV